MILAYSYLRFSSAKQAKGKSIARQVKARDAWLLRHPEVTLDLNLRLPGNRKLEDKGRSAFRRRAPDRYALTAFLKLVEGGDVDKGSYLILENLDRLSREETVPATHLLTGLLMAGIRVVQLEPEEMVLTAQSDPFSVMRAVMELSRGHGESAIKSTRSDAHWKERKDAARAAGEIVTAQCPGWLAVAGRVQVGRRVQGGRFKVIEERAVVVRRIFTLACEGLGLYAIAKRLTEEGAKPFGRGERWAKGTVHRVLTNRAALGEYQPRRLGREDGQVIPNYYPAVVDEIVWQRAQGALARRKWNGGRAGERVACLFTGLLTDATSGSRLLIATGPRVGPGKAERQRMLVSADALEGAAPFRSFPYAVFESAILRQLREVNPADVTGEQVGSEAVALAADLAAHRARMAQVEAELAEDETPVPGLARALRAMNDREKELAAALRAAQSREALPQTQAWTQAQSLLDAARDELARFRLRGLLQTIIERVWVLLVPCGGRRSWRWCAVQIRFAGGGRRDYLIGYSPAANHRPGGWVFASESDSTALGEFDLSDRADVEALSRQLAQLPPVPF